MRVIVLLGTRPEAVKLAPVVAELRRHPAVELLVVSTGQHREMLDQILAGFGIQPDVDLDLLSAWRDRLPSLSEITSRALDAVTRTLEAHPADLLFVQGDTTTAFAGALAAFYLRVPVAHVEAGLRTNDLYDPFPEEANRSLIGRLASLHFAPTELARRNLLREGVAPAAIHVTGNTSIDALHAILAQAPAEGDTQLSLKTILVTLHRRENWGDRMVAACRALRRVLDDVPDVAIRFPMHRNPVVRRAVRGVLVDHPRACLEEPLEYVAFVRAMARAHVIVTDSGGVQEEGPALGKPILVLRETTERPEGVDAGTARLVGTAEEDVYRAIRRLLDDPDEYATMARAANPYGDGRAAQRIVDIALRYLSERATERAARRSPEMVQANAARLP